MFVRQRDLEAAQDEIARLRGELEQMRASLAQYQSQERELVDALVSSRAEARQMRTLAEAQAKDLVEAARAQATSAQAQAREVVERARAEANDVEAQARERIAAVESEIARLRQVHGELNASLQQSLAALTQVIPNASGLVPPPTASGSTRVLTPSPPAPPWAPAAAQRTTDSRSGWQAAVGAPARTASPAPPDRPASTSAKQQRELVAAWAGGFLALLQTRKGAVIVAVAAVGILSLAARVGVPAVWHEARTEVKSSVDEASSPSTAAATLPESGSTSLTGAATGPNTAATGLTVALRAVRAVWLRADIDGRTAPARLMKAGEDLELRGAREVVVRVGDAGAVLVGFNGKTHTVLGQTGAAVTKRFEAERQNDVVRAVGAPPRTDGSPAPTLPASSSPHARTRRSTEPRSLGAQPLPASYQRTDRARSPAPVPQTGARRPGQMMAATGGNDEADVLRAHEAYFDALRKGDSGELNRVLADGFSASGAPAMTDSGLPHPISLGNASVEIRGLGAVVSGIASQHITGPDGQRLRDQPLMFSEVWVKRDGQWQLMNVRFVSAGTR
jgi:hypothetical protein